MDWPLRHSGGTRKGKGNTTRTIVQTSNATPSPLPTTPHPQCSPSHLSTLLFSLLSRADGHVLSSKNIKFTTLLNLIQPISDCRSEVTVSAGVRSNSDPNREKLTAILDSLYTLTTSGMELDPFLLNEDDDDDDDDDDNDLVIPFLIPGTRHAPTWDLNPDDGLLVPLPKNQQTETKRKAEWTIRLGRVCVTTLRNYLLGIDKPWDKIVVRNFLRNLSLSRSSDNISARVTNFNSVVFTPDGIQRLAGFDDRANKRRKLLGGARETSKTRKTSGSDEYSAGFLTENPIPRLLELGVIRECPQPQRKKFNNTSRYVTEDNRNIGVEISSPTDKYGYVLSIPGLIPMTHDTLNSYREGLLSLLKKNNTKSGGGVSSSGYGVPVQGINGVHAWMEKFANAQAAKRQRNKLLYGSNGTDLDNEGERYISVGFLVRDIVSRGMAAEVNRGGAGGQYLKLVL